jgi:hypothetical protein
VGNDDLVRERQAEARAPLLGRVEQVEDVLALCLVDACAFIVNLNPHAAVVPHRFELGGPPVGHRFTRIAQEIEQRLPKLRLIHGHCRQLRREVQPELDARSVHLASYELRRVTQEMSSSSCCIDSSSRLPSEPGS